MNRYALVFCVLVVLAGCPVQSGAPPYDLTLIVTNSDTDDGVINTSTHLTGKPPTDIVYHSVKLVVINNSRTNAEYKLGNISTSRSVVRQNFSTTTHPDKILIKYDSVSGAEQPGIIKGRTWNSDTQRYEEFTDYQSGY